MNKKVVIIGIVCVLLLIAVFSSGCTEDDEKKGEDQKVLDDIDRSNQLMAPFFQSFDLNENGGIESDEAERFFYTVEKNAPYRYDNENTESPNPGYTVGDGRSGNDYHQLPLETYVEKEGDCEDFAILECAFYNYFGIEAYVVAVDTVGTSYPTHALCIVNIGSKEEWDELLGHPVHTYSLGENSFLIVDNAYSAEFGAIDSGGTYEISEGTFRLHKKMDLVDAVKLNTPYRSPLPNFPGLNHWTLLEDVYNPDDFEDYFSSDEYWDEVYSDNAEWEEWDYEEYYAEEDEYYIEYIDEEDEWWEEDEYYIDSDGDGYSDGWEKEYGTDPYDEGECPPISDEDYERDSDGDGWSDGDENDAGTDPFDGEDYPDEHEEIEEEDDTIF